MLISKAELQAIIFASKDNSRQQLNGIHITETQTIATDGHRMIAIDRGEVPKLEVFKKMEKVTLPVTISLATVESVLKAWPKTRKSHTFDCHKWANLEPGSLTVVDADQNLIAYPVTFQDGKYPNYQSVFVSEEKRPHRIGLNVKYLADSIYMAKAGKDNLIEIRINKDTESALLIGENSQGQVCKQIIMHVVMGADAIKQAESDKYNKLIEDSGIDTELIRGKLKDITPSDLVQMADGRQYLKTDIEKLLTKKK